MLGELINFEDLWKERQIVGKNPFQFYTVSIEHLIELKKHSNRIQDQSDILLLSKIKNEQL